MRQLMLLLLVVALFVAVQGHRSSSSSSSSSSSAPSSFSFSGSNSKGSFSFSFSLTSSSDSSSSSSDSRHHHHEPHCCDPCKILKDEGSEYYRKCGQFLTEEEAFNNYKYCEAAKGNKKQLALVIKKFRTQCYSNFAVLIHFSCPSHYHYGNCDAISFNKWKEECNVDYCPSKEAECDQCQALMDSKSHFYKVCGHAISERLLKVWFIKCKAITHDSCAVEELRSMILGHCHCVNPDVIPDMCSTSETHCTDEPAKDENALEACSWILDTDSIYHDCMTDFGMDKVKELHQMCVEIYCEKGSDGVCDFAQNVAEICKRKFGGQLIEWTTLHVCQVLTTSTTTTTTTTTTTLPDECVMDGITIPFGEEDVVLPGCTKICNCTTPRTPECRAMHCAIEHATCLAEAGKNFCNCTDDYEGDGIECSPPPIPECVGKELDLVFIVDSSASISSVDFNKMKDFVRDAIFDTDVGANKTRVGIISFANVAKTETHLGELNSKPALNLRISQMEHMKLLTYTDKAIAEAEAMYTNYGRADAKKVMIIATDGRSTNQAATLSAMQSFRAAHVNATVLAVAVTNSGDVDISEIRALASGLMDTNALTVDDFDALLVKVRNLTKEACKDQDDTDEPTYEIDTEDNNNKVPIPMDCKEIFYYEPSLGRWHSFYGVYDIVLGQGLCNHHFVYVHTGFRFYLQWSGSRWEISSKACQFDEFSQPRSAIVYGAPAAGKTYVISEGGDTWEEPPDTVLPQVPTSTDSITECF